MINNHKLKIGTGWIPDFPDIRDYSINTPKIQQLLKTSSLQSNQLVFPDLGIPNLTDDPIIVDLRSNCPPIRSQENYGSCTAFAAIGVFEYHQKKSLGRFIELSPMFLYKVTRTIHAWYHDSGATIRGTIGALSTFGVCHEKHWAYNGDWINEEPGVFQYSQAQNYKTLNYFRLDTSNVTNTRLLELIRQQLRKGLPIVCGFSLYPSFINTGSDGIVPEVSTNEQLVSGHAVGIFGYNDDKQYFIVRNSWGDGWGDDGYCYMPYSYLLNGLMADFWVMIKNTWVDTTQFSL